MKKIAIIGGGWSGCAAAVELARQGRHVILFESARTLGGRARHVALDGKDLDNGQHILLGAYQETLRLMRLVGINSDQAMLRLPLQMRYPPGANGMDFIAARLPAPFHLLWALVRATGLNTQDKMALSRFSTTARWMDWQLHNDCTVSELLERFDQTARIIQLMWRPLCIAALNTPPERASAQVFLSVLRDSLGAKRAASDMLIPRIDLTALFPRQAAAFIERHDGIIRCGTTVKSIAKNGMQWQLEISDTPDKPGSVETFDALIITTQATHTASLLNGLVANDKLPAFDYEPITTCYLQYRSDFRLTQPFFALIDDAAHGEWGQFVFDRGQLDSGQAGLLSVVVSASSAATALSHAALIAAIVAQLSKVLQAPELEQPQWAKIISEKRATFSCTPGLHRPDNDTGLNGLLIAGDYTIADYPATLEAAVRSGVQAAQMLIN